jgi:hypothetical protein
MKAILLALAAGALLFAVGTWQLCRVPGGKGAGTWLLIYFAILPVFAAVHLLTPPDLGVLPSAFQIPIPIIDLGFFFFLYTVGFFGGVLQLYNLADRGFSLRILIDIQHAPQGVVTLEEVMKYYSAGRGIAWMYRKRVQGMIATGLVVENDGQLVLTDRGHRVARLFSWLQDVACVEKAQVRN